jgi:tetrahydromethanopterin:alpha-L-glutamate ligase
VLRIGVISAYPDLDWHAQRIALAAGRHDHADILQPTDFCAEVKSGASRVQARGRDAREYDLFLTPRALGDEGDADVQLELYRLLAATGAKVVNDVDALLRALDKLRTSWELARAGLPTPEVRVVQTAAQAEAALAALGRAVAKPVYGSLGSGVERLERGDGARAQALVSRWGALYLQRYVDDALVDVRAFVVGDRVEAAVQRQPQAGEFRGNVQLGADVEPIVLDAATAALAVRATQLLGLVYSGVDLLVTPRGAELIEVNGTPAWQSIFVATGRDMAPAIVDEATRARRLKRAG